MHELRYQDPATVADAVVMLSGTHVRLLAGGSDLIPQMREGRRLVAGVVDLKRIPALTAIERDAAGNWRIGAAASIGSLGRNARFAGEHASLLESARLIGSLQVQSRASLGGNLCNAAPSADGVPLLISLGTTGDIAGPGGTRTIPVAAIATGPGRTSLAADELLVTLNIPALAPRSAAKYLRFTPRREMDIAVVGAGGWLRLAADGTVAGARLTLASVGPTPVVADAACDAMVGHRPTTALLAAAGEAAAQLARPISDTRGSAAYRRELVAVLTRRVFASCLTQLGVALA